MFVFPFPLIRCSFKPEKIAADSKLEPELVSGCGLLRRRDDPDLRDLVALQIQVISEPGIGSVHVFGRRKQSGSISKCFGLSECKTIYFKLECAA
jgi:hypothetical protein